MPRTAPLLAVAAAAGALAWRRRRGGTPGLRLLGRRQDDLPEGTETHPAPLVDLRGDSSARPPRPETPTEVVADFYRGAPPA